MRLASVLIILPLLITNALAIEISPTAHIKVVTPISFDASITTLKFGTFATTGAGTIVITNNNAIPTGGVQLITDASTPRTSAKVKVKGELGLPYTLVLPTAAVTLTGSGGNTMTVTSLKCNDTGLTGSSIRTLATSPGEDEVTINGTLNVKASQTIGNYSGSFNVTANY